MISLGRKISSRVIIGTLILTTTITAFNILDLRQKMIKESAQRTLNTCANISKSISEPLAVALVFGDQDLIKSMLDPVKSIVEAGLSKSDLVYAVLYDSKKNILYQKSNVFGDKFEITNRITSDKAIGEYEMTEVELKDQKFRQIEIPILKDTESLGKIVFGY
jgi:hypothetical protein